MAIKTSNVINANTTASSTCTEGNQYVCTELNTFRIVNNSSIAVNVVDYVTLAPIQTIAPNDTVLFTSNVKIANGASFSLRHIVYAPPGTLINDSTINILFNNYPVGIPGGGCSFYILTNV